MCSSDLFLVHNVQFSGEESPIAGPFDFVLRVGVNVKLQGIELVGGVRDVHLAEVASLSGFWFDLHTWTHGGKGEKGEKGVRSPTY